MKKWQKGIVAVILVIVIFNIVIYAVSGDTILHFISSGRENSNVKLEKVGLLEDNYKETIKYNDITITMVKCVFDNESTFGYSEFDISRRGGFSEEMYGNGTFSDGKSWYKLERLATGSYEYNTELNDDGTLHMEYRYNGYDSNSDEDFIGLFHTSHFDKPIEPIDKFILSDKYKPSEIKHINNGITAVISPLGIRIDNAKLPIGDSVDMKYEDGTNITYKINGKSTLSDGDIDICWIDFDDYTQIDAVTSLVINENEYFTER